MIVVESVEERAVREREERAVGAKRYGVMSEWDVQGVDEVDEGR